MIATETLDLTPAIPIFLRRLHADSTRAAYAREVARFLAWLEGNGPLDAEVLPRYVEVLRGRKLSPTFIAWRATVVAAFLRDAHRQGVLDRDLVTGYRLPRGTRGFAPRVLSAAELKRLLAAPDARSWQGRRDLAVLVCLGVGGLRAGEVCRLRVGDVDLSTYRVTLRVTGKGDKRRLVSLAGRPASPLRAWARVRGDAAPDAPWLLARRAVDGTPPRGLNVAAVDYITRRTARVAGMAGVHAHALRHSAASLALTRGVRLHEVRDQLGHASIVTTSRYLHVTVMASRFSQ